jgi:hypothetical protein
MLLILILATAAMAADPSIGTWKLNPAKSKVISGDAGTPPREQTLVKRELNADQLEAVFTGIGRDGTSFVSKSIFPKEGGVISFPQGSFRNAIMTVVGPGDCYVTYLRDGKQTSAEHWVVSADGKTMVNTDYGNRQGKPFTAEFLWERQ